MDKISWTAHRAHVSNEEVLSLVNEQRCLVHVIKQRQANWIGHVLRHDCLLKTVLEGKMEGKRTRGKPRRKMLDLLMEQEDKKISYLQELKRRAKDRIQWHQCFRAEHTRRRTRNYVGNRHDKAGRRCNMRAVHYETFRINLKTCDTGAYTGVQLESLLQLQIQKYTFQPLFSEYSCSVRPICLSEKVRFSASIGTAGD